MTAGVELSHNPQELRGEVIRRSNCCLSVHHLSLLIGTRLHSAVWVWPYPTAILLCLRLGIVGIHENSQQRNCLCVCYPERRSFFIVIVIVIVWEAVSLY